MAEKFDPPLEVDLGDNPRKIKFRSVEKAKAWIEKEQKVWEGFVPNPLQNYGQYYARFLTQQRQHIAAVLRAANDAASIGENTVVPTDLENALTQYKQRNCIHAESAVGKLILSQVDENSNKDDIQTALAFLGVAQGFVTPIQELNQRPYLNDNFRPFLHGVAKHDLWTSPTPNWADAERNAIAEALADWVDKLSAHETEQERAATEIAKLETQINELHETQEREFNELKEEYETKFKTFEEYYREKVRTEAPANYWQRKSLWHTIFGYFFQTIFLLGAGYVTYKGYELSSSLPPAFGDATASATGDAGEGMRDFLGRALALLIPGFFAVWILRVLLKIGLSHLATADDARHRVTLVNMYMSLIEHEGKLEPADRILMLQALFRPTPGRTGDEDTAPPNWFSILMERVKK